METLRNIQKTWATLKGSPQFEVYSNDESSTDENLNFLDNIEAQLEAKPLTEKQNWASEREILR